MAAGNLERIFNPPEVVRGLTVLDKCLFNKRVTVPAIAVPVKECTSFLSHFKDHVLKVPGIKKFVTPSRPPPLCEEKNENEKLLLLSPIESDGLSDDKKGWITSHNGRLTTHEISLDYTNYTMSDILRAVIPSDEVPSSFETVGHIAHLNLRDHQLPYKNLIGQVIIDKRPNIRTVVNKTNSIDETFRTFHMELLAGDDDLMTTVHQSKCTFKFDFSKVYWNSRLETEHKRIVTFLKPHDVLIDMFAGVGPFAIPAAKKGCHVYANDLNPCSYQSLLDNAQWNKVTVQAYNLDGREFIRQIKDKIVPEILTNSNDNNSSIEESHKSDIHIVMNLPSIAIEFLDCLKGFYDSIPKNSTMLRVPLVHCYSFSNSPTPENDVVKRVRETIGVELDSYDVFNVRDVSPNKLMMRISFPLPKEVLWTVSQAGVKRLALNSELEDKEEEREEENNCDVSLTKRRCNNN